jgi:hypothetical protein
MESDKLKSLYVDAPLWVPDIKVDDFIVTIGVNKSNSVYHVAEVRISAREKMKRAHLKVYVSDLVTALRRSSGQKLIPITWYKRKKKGD